VKLVSQAFHDVASKERRRWGWKGERPKARNHEQWYTSSRVLALSDGLCRRGYPQSYTEELDLLIETQICLKARRKLEKGGGIYRRVIGVLMKNEAKQMVTPYRDWSDAHRGYCGCGLLDKWKRGASL
jgi:hypothetical protein